MVGFLNTYFELLLFIEIIYITNKCNQYVIFLFFIPFVRLYTRNIQTAVSPLENWTHVYMNLFTRNSPYYNLLKYLLFLLKHPVYFQPSHTHLLTLLSQLTCRRNCRKSLIFPPLSPGSRRFSVPKLFASPVTHAEC